MVAAACLWTIEACSEGGRSDSGGSEAGADAAIRDGRGGRGDGPAPDLTIVGSDRCGGGPLLRTTGNELSFSGTTVGAKNEYGKKIRCGASAPLAGGQRYYRIPMVAATVYRLTLQPEFAAVFYLVSACGENIINADCSSDGATGDVVSVAKGQRGALVFRPTASGTYFVAIDSASSDVAGSFRLTLESFSKPANNGCSAPTKVKLSGGKAQIKGTLLGAVNELGSTIECGLNSAFDGPQRYYELSLDHSHSYRISLKTDFDGGLYLFNRKASCKAANIEKDCSTFNGTVLPRVSANEIASTLFTPPADGSYLLAVDTTADKLGGDYTVAIEQVTPQGNTVCSKATSIALSGGSATVSGDTSTSINDLGAHLYCGGPRLVGPQVYYEVQLAARAYQLALVPQFDGVLGVGKACLTLPIDCASSGLSGDSIAVKANTSGHLTFTPKQAATYVVFVDSARRSSSGKFQLTLREASAPTNGKCTAPQALSLVGSTVTIAGDTGPLKNDLVGVDCGSSAGPWNGSQAYYRLALKSGQQAVVELVPGTRFDGALYAFDASTTCKSSAVDAACKGLSSDTVGPGAVERLTLKAAADISYVIAVDSWSPSEVGPFSLKVTVSTP